MPTPDSPSTMILKTLGLAREEGGLEVGEVGGRAVASLRPSSSLFSFSSAEEREASSIYDLCKYPMSKLVVHVQRL